MITRRLGSFARKFGKLCTILGCTDYHRALRHGIRAAVEHEDVLRVLACRYVVDVGANRGQFAVVARHCLPHAQIVSFEPLEAPAAIFRTMFENVSDISLICSGIGTRSGTALMHVSAMDHSSSLLPISERQAELFPGTQEQATTTVKLATLDEYISAPEIIPPSLLKIDVQGYELETLRGCTRLLEHFDHVYVECSFVELYVGQSLAGDVIGFLAAKGFRLRGVHNVLHDEHGLAIQGDFLFARQTAPSSRA